MPIIDSINHLKAFQMRKSIILLFFVSATYLGSCKHEKHIPKEQNVVPKVSKEDLDPDEEKGQALLDKCIAAHGGFDTWKQFEGLEYLLNDNGKEVYQVTNIKNRKAYIKSENYEVGFDGTVAWSKPDASKVSGQSAAFYYNLDFYFIGIPFLLKDPGAHVRYAGQTMINGANYESLKITFGSNVGLTPEDVYFAYIDPNSFILQILTYSISYFDKGTSQINSAKVYSHWKKIQGILMPEKMENFIWENGGMGKSKNHIRKFSEIHFLHTIPDESIFEIPVGAVVEKVSQ